jgi:predicted  nucleic acid-binding Zn-ribbon protein
MALTLFNACNNDVPRLQANYNALYRKYSNLDSTVFSLKLKDSGSQSKINSLESKINSLKNNL